MSRAVVINGKLRHLQGWKKGRPDHRDFRLTAPGPILPTHADLTPSCPPVFDQGALGSCTANAGSGVMAFLEKKASEDKPFSRLFIYFYTRQLEGVPPAEDSGAEIRDVMKALAQFGAPYEETWPYDERRFMEEPPSEAKAEASQHKALFYYLCPNLFTTKASLAQGFPVAFGFPVPHNMMDGKAAATGEVHYPGPTEGYEGGHAVMAVGYDDDKSIGSEVGAILCQNSWGPAWGLHGRFWLPYRFWKEGLADDNWTLRQAQV